MYFLTYCWRHNRMAAIEVGSFTFAFFAYTCNSYLLTFTIWMTCDIMIWESFFHFMTLHSFFLDTSFHFSRSGVRFFISPFAHLGLIIIMADNYSYRTLLAGYWDWAETHPLLSLNPRQSNWEYEPKNMSDNFLPLSKWHSTTHKTINRSLYTLTGYFQLFLVFLSTPP